MADTDELTLREAAQLVGATDRPPAHVEDADRPANRPGAEATAHLDVMLGASRKGKVVRGDKPAQT